MPMDALSRRALVAGAFMMMSAPAWSQPVPTKPVTIELFGLASHNWQPVVDKFQADYPNIKINNTKFGTDELKQALRVGASSGKLPDVWWNWGGSLASPYNRAGFTLKMTPELLKQYGIEQNVTPSFMELAKDGQDLYGVPNRATPFSLIYKKSLFSKYNIKEPTSFADLEKAAETLKANGVTPFSIGGKFSWMTMRFFDFFLEHYAGPAGHDAFLNLETPWTAEPVIKAFTKLKEWSDKGYFPKGFLNVDPATNVTALYNDQAAMIFDPANIETTRFIREGQSPADYGSFPLPTDHKPLRVPGSPGQFQINAKSSEDARQAALLFASYIVKPENAATVAQTYGYPSAVKGVLPPENLPIQRAWAEWIQEDVGFHKLTDQGLPQDVVAAYFEAQDSVILGAITPKEAGEQVQEAITRFKKRSN